MLSNKPIAFTLVTSLVKGQSADGKALAQALFKRIVDRTSGSCLYLGENGTFKAFKLPAFC